jgi:hypothetical protein
LAKVQWTFANGESPIGESLIGEIRVSQKCIGKKSSEPWSVQDSTAYLLNEYLPKILTKEKFNIGLDCNLFNLYFQEKQYRQQLTAYALNDCLSMQRILINMKNANSNLNFIRINIFKKIISITTN